MKVIFKCIKPRNCVGRVFRPCLRGNLRFKLLCVRGKERLEHPGLFEEVESG
jgi:hypothetical protein